MKILTISGSARTNANNSKLLDALPVLFPQYQISRYEKLDQLPLFTADAQEKPDPPIVEDWKSALNDCDAVIISTPEYLHNLPALLKNAFEWITTSGELADKKVLAISFSPHPPRGEKAMQSLLWSLQALKANVVAQLPLYQNEVFFDEQNRLVENESMEMIREAFSLLSA